MWLLDFKFCFALATFSFYIKCYKMGGPETHLPCEKNIKVQDAKLGSWEHLGNHAKTFRSHIEEQYVDKHVG